MTSVRVPRYRWTAPLSASTRESTRCCTGHVDGLDFCAVYDQMKPVGVHAFPEFRSRGASGFRVPSKRNGRGRASIAERPRGFMGSRVADIASNAGIVLYSLTHPKAKSVSREYTVLISDRTDLPKRPCQAFLGRLEECQLLKFRVIQKQTWNARLSRYGKNRWATVRSIWIKHLVDDDHPEYVAVRQRYTATLPVGDDLNGLVRLEVIDRSLQLVGRIADMLGSGGPLAR